MRMNHIRTENENLKLWISFIYYACRAPLHGYKPRCWMGYPVEIKSTLFTWPILILFADGQLQVGSVWSGLNDVTKEGTFQWSDGTPLTYTPSIPQNDDDDDCAMFVKVREGVYTWRAAGCTDRNKFICEINISHRIACIHNHTSWPVVTKTILSV